MKFLKKYRLVDPDLRALSSPSSSSPPSSTTPPRAKDPLEPPAVTETRETKRAIEDNLSRTDVSTIEQLLVHNQLAGRYREAVKEATGTQNRLDQVLTKLLEKLSGEERQRDEQKHHPPPLVSLPSHLLDGVDPAPSKARKRKREPLLRSPVVTRGLNKRKPTPESIRGVPLKKWTTKV